MLTCEECGWEGYWEDVWVEHPHPTDPGNKGSVIGPDPRRLECGDGPYYCPDCKENLETVKTREVF